MGVVAIARSSRNKLPSLGAEAWAKFADAEAAGLFAARGAVLGKLDGEMLVFDGPEHQILLGASRSEPPAPPAMDETARTAVSRAIAEGLGPFFPQARQVLEKAQSVSIEGGYVFAQGQGDLNDRLSTLHRRDLFGVRKLGRYVSIDTGKYSTAPIMAREQIGRAHV